MASTDKGGVATAYKRAVSRPRPRINPPAPTTSTGGGGPTRNKPKEPRGGRDGVNPKLIQPGPTLADIGRTISSFFGPRAPAYGGVYNPTVKNPAAPAAMDAARGAFLRAFGMREPAYGGMYNPTATNPAFRNPFAAPVEQQRRPTVRDLYSQYLAGGRGGGAGRGTMASNPYYWVTYPQLPPPEVPTYEGGGGGYGYGYGGGGGGGGGADYLRRLNDLLARWNIE